MRCRASDCPSHLELSLFCNFGRSLAFVLDRCQIDGERVRVSCFVREHREHEDARESNYAKFRLQEYSQNSRLSITMFMLHAVKDCNKTRSCRLERPLQKTHLNAF